MSEPDVLPIVGCGDPVLRRPAQPLDAETLRSSEIRRLIGQMKATMEAAPGVGLAAPQVGVCLQLLVMADGPERWTHLDEDERTAREREALPFTVLANPKLVPAVRSTLVTFYEGCLSVPGLTGAVARHRSVRVSALDENGEPVEHVFTGWPARIAQHEIDHLAGRLYLDRVETRSLSTLESYSRLWAGHPTKEAAEALGFPLA